MKNILIMLVIFLSFTVNGQVFTLKVEDGRKGLSNSIVVNLKAKPFSLSCNSGVLNAANKSCTLTEQIIREEECPAGYVLQNDSTCDATTTVSASRYCSQGVDVGSYCEVYHSPVDASGNCPTYYYKRGSNCYHAWNYSYSCPSGFSLSGSLCTRVLTTAATLASCPEGYTEVSTELCERVTITDATITCSNGVYEEERDACF